MNIHTPAVQMKPGEQATQAFPPPPQFARVWFTNSTQVLPLQQPVQFPGPQVPAAWQVPPPPGWRTQVLGVAQAAQAPPLRPHSWPRVPGRQMF